MLKTSHTKIFCLNKFYARINVTWKKYLNSNSPFDIPFGEYKHEEVTVWKYT